jgi:hypothetical protein
MFWSNRRSLDGGQVGLGRSPQDLLHSHYQMSVEEQIRRIVAPPRNNNNNNINDDINHGDNNKKDITAPSSFQVLHLFANRQSERTIMGVCWK